MNDKPARPSLKKLLIANAILWVTAILRVVGTPNFVSSREKAQLPSVLGLVMLSTVSCHLIRQARAD